MNENREFLGLTPTMLRRIAVLLGALGVVWGAIEALVALEILDADSALSPFDGRTGMVLGVATAVVWLCGVGGVALVQGRPALACALLFTAGSGGFILVGAPWIGPGTLLSLGSWAALMAIPNPFGREMSEERQIAAARRGSAQADGPQG